MQTFMLAASFWHQISTRDTDAQGLASVRCYTVKYPTDWAQDSICIVCSLIYLVHG